MNRVAVIMSTYNGEQYLAEQMDSILAQRDVEIALYIRDDGSHDNTLSILKEYAKWNDNITVIEGKNVGVGSSFMFALKSAGTQADCYAFADQDDIWLPEKMCQAIEYIKKSGEDKPVCYCSNQTLVDAKGKVIKTRHDKAVDTDCLQILCNNRVTGCTMVWNRELQKILSDDRYTPSSELLKKRIHDVWVAMVAATVGTVYYDPDSYIYYRQHENNVVGVKRESILRLWRNKIANPELRRGRSSLAQEIIALFGRDMVKEKNYERLLACADYSKSLRKKLLLMKDREIRKRSSEDILTYSIKVMFGLF